MLTASPTKAILQEGREHDSSGADGGEHDRVATPEQHPSHGLPRPNSDTQTNTTPWWLCGSWSW